MKKILYLVIVVALFLKCKDAEENNVKLTFEESIQNILTNSTWNYMNVDTKIIINVELKANKNITLTAYNIVNTTELGKEIFQSIGTWRIKRDKILVNFKGSKEIQRWTIENDFSKIYQDNKYVFHRYKPEIIKNTIDELKRKYHFSEKENFSLGNGSKKLPDSLLGKYEGIQESYYMKNEEGRPVIIKGQKIAVPSSQFSFVIKTNNLVDLKQKNLQDNSIYNYQTGKYKIIEEKDNLFILECSSFGQDYTSLTYILKLNTLNKTAIVNSGNNSEPSFTITKISEPGNKHVSIDNDFVELASDEDIDLIEPEHTNDDILLIPQEIEYNGKPDLEYSIDGKRTVLDDYSENNPQEKYIRMKFNDKEVLLKNIKNETTKYKRVYAGNNYKVVFKINKYGDCAGEGTQWVYGNVFIKLGKKQYSTTFEGIDTLFSSQQCKEIGNG
jgi:hypothetical protein